MRGALLSAAILSFLSAGLAGCLESDLSLLTAKDAREQADREAAEWADDAQLVSLYGMEAGPEARRQMAEMADAAREGEAGADRDGEDDEELDAEFAMVGAVAGTEDDDVGDGHAPLWAFAYASEEMEGYLAVAVTSEGILFVEEEGGEPDLFAEGRPVTDWRLDSDEAAEVAGTNEGFAAALDDPEAFVYTMLFEGKDGPVWIYGVESGADDGEDESMVALSAVDGRMLDADELVSEIFGFVIREFGEASGLGGVQVMATFGSEFEVQLGGHETMAVVVTVSPPPVMPMQVTVTDPEGMEYTGTIDGSVGLESSSTIHLEAVPAGDYEVSVAVEVGAANNWEIAWCTDGTAILPQANRACEVVGTAAAAPSLGSLWETLSPLRRSPAA